MIGLKNYGVFYLRWCSMSNMDEAITVPMSPQEHIATAETWLNKIEVEDLYADDIQAYSEVAKAHAIVACAKITNSLLHGGKHPSVSDMVGSGGGSLLGLMRGLTHQH